MRLKILHRTHYAYSASVAENYNEVRLQPVSDAIQECHDFSLATSPDAQVKRYQDLHLNRVDHFYITDPHPSLTVEARATVTTLGRATVRESIGFPLARIAECQRLEHCYDFLQMSEYVSLDVEVWRLAQDATAGRADAWQAAQAIMALVHREFAYDGQATTVQTHMREVLRLRRGVCQDFAHVMLGLCRSVKIPARYVSGYLYVGAGESLRGALASHAWVEVFIPGHGWLGLDPTNNSLVDEHHVKVAVGGDYADAAPIRGNFKGRAEQVMTVTLDIQREEISA